MISTRTYPAVHARTLALGALASRSATLGATNSLPSRPTVGRSVRNVVVILSVLIGASGLLLDAPKDLGRRSVAPAPTASSKLLQPSAAKYHRTSSATNAKSATDRGIDWDGEHECNGFKIRKSGAKGKRDSVSAMLALVSSFRWSLSHGNGGRKDSTHSSQRLRVLLGTSRAARGAAW